MWNRSSTRRLKLGGVAVGGGAPVSVQSMTKTDTRNVRATVRQIGSLEEAGCEIVLRVSGTAVTRLEPGEDVEAPVRAREAEVKKTSAEGENTAQADAGETERAAE